MTAVWTIARREFRSSFLSPKAGAIYFFFLLCMGLFFFDFVRKFIELQQQAPGMGGQGATLEQVIRALFYNLHFILILVVPAVTMATFAEDKKTQVYRLLQTAPATATQIVLGKFLAVAGLMTAVLLSTLIYPAFLIKYGNPDVGVIASSYLGVFLLVMAQLSFGLWVSTLTSSQIMAFLFTMLGLFGLLILNWLASGLSGSGVVEKVLQYIASTEHLDSFLKGSITVADTVYFVLFTALFLFLTNIVLDSQRWR